MTPHFDKSNRQIQLHPISLFIMSLIVSALTACSSPGSPVIVNASISPEPVVGREVTLHVEISSRGGDLPNTTLEVYLPEEGVELVRGDTKWQGDIDD